MPVHKIQTSFSGGEFSPALKARTDIQKYSIGLNLLRNMYVESSGGASNRPGTKYVATALLEGRIRLIPFEFNAEQAYVIEFGDGYVRFFTDNALVPNTANLGAWSALYTYQIGDSVTYLGNTYVCNLINNLNNLPTGTPFGWNIVIADSGYSFISPYSDFDLPLLKFSQSADILFISHPDFAPRELIRLANNRWRFQELNGATYNLVTGDTLAAINTNGPFMLQNVVVAKQIKYNGTTLISNFDIFAVGHVGAFFKLIQPFEGVSVEATLGVGAGLTGNIYAQSGGTWRLKITPVAGTKWGGFFRVFANYRDGTSVVIQEFRGDAALNLSITENTFDVIRGNVVSLSLAYNLTITGTFVHYSFSVDSFINSAVFQITAVTDTKNATATLKSPVALQNVYTSNWSEGSWSTYRGFPRAVDFFQDRLSFAGTRGEPATTWNSKTSNYYDFGISSPLVDSDSISVNLPSRKINQINHLVALVDLMAMTHQHECSVGPPQGQVYAPTTASQRIHSGRGSSDCRPILVGNRIVFAQFKGSVIRDMGYDYQSQTYAGDDLTILSKHFFKKRVIEEMAYQEIPNSLLWLVRDDGALLCCTYNKEQDMAAWSLHETDGIIESIVVISADGFDELWMSVNRGGTRYIERMVQRMESDLLEDQYFVDSGLSFSSPAKVITNVSGVGPSTVTSNAHGFSNGDIIDIRDIIGKTELNGQQYEIENVTANTFQLVGIDTTEMADYISGGTARLAVDEVDGLDHLDGETVAILGNGGVYEQQEVVGGAITLDPPASIVHVGLPYVAELQTLSPELGLKDGTLQDRKVFIAQATVKLENTRGGYIGADEDHQDPIIHQTDDLTPAELITAKSEMVLNTQYEDQGLVYISQPDPLPITVLAIIPKITVGG